MTLTEQLYINDITNELVDRGNSISTDIQRNKKVTFSDTLKLTLLNAYVEIMEYYLRDTITGDSNFFTTTEAEDIMQHINEITGKTYWLELS